MIGEGKDSFPSSAKRWNTNAQKVEPMKEILSESALLDHLSKILVCSSDDSNLYLDFFGSSDSSNDTVFDG